MLKTQYNHKLCSAVYNLEKLSSMKDMSLDVILFELVGESVSVCVCVYVCVCVCLADRERKGGIDQASCMCICVCACML